jgi:ubiquinone/menaquinone biosynthesis C-methylase UbiE
MHAWTRAGLPVEKDAAPMKMHRFEKLFVNSDRHSNRVATQAAQRIRRVDPRPGQRLLDVGCGNGAALIHLAHTLGLDVTGLDIDPDQIQTAAQAARGLPSARFLVSDATKLPLPDDRFDIVYTNKATHHVSDWPHAIAEMARVLTPGGYLIYSDFTAPFGRRLPTRRGVDTTAQSHGLERTGHSRSPFHYTAYFRKQVATPASATAQSR